MAYSDALAHLCFGNKRLTKQICGIALNVITVSDFNRIGSYLELVESQLEMDDVDQKTGQRLLPRRLEWIFGFPCLNNGI